MEAEGRIVQTHVRRKLLVGLVVFLPFALTIWILYKIVEFGNEQLTRPLIWLLNLATERKWSYLREWIWSREDQDYLFHVKLVVFLLSLALTILMLYALGLVSTTFLGKRYIGMIERALLRIPGAQFLYSTFKQVVEMLSQPRSKAFQKVVLVDYPRTGTRCLAFFTGITAGGENGETLVNVFLPTTPNPTSGFLMLVRPHEVWETNLTVAQASRFIFSFGVVELDKIRIRPFPIDEYLSREARPPISTAPEPPAPDEAAPQAGIGKE